MDLDVLVADGRVMEGAKNVVDNFVDGDAGVFPGVQDAALYGQLRRRCMETGNVRDDVLQDGSGYTAAA